MNKRIGRESKNLINQRNHYHRLTSSATFHFDCFDRHQNRYEQITWCVFLRVDLPFFAPVQFTNSHNILIFMFGACLNSMCFFFFSLLSFRGVLFLASRTIFDHHSRNQAVEMKETENYSCIRSFPHTRIYWSFFTTINMAFLLLLFYWKIVCVFLHVFSIHLSLSLSPSFFLSFRSHVLLWAKPNESNSFKQKHFGFFLCEFEIIFNYWNFD